MNFGAQKDAQARCRTGSLPSGHIRMRGKNGEMVLPTHRYCCPIIPSARLWIFARAFLSWYHFPISVCRSERNHPSKRRSPRISTAKEERKNNWKGEHALPRTALFLRLRDNGQVGNV
jgi:hypothetical protein